MGINIYTTKTVYYEVSCGVVVGWVLKATWARVWILQARCVTCCIFSAVCGNSRSGRPRFIFAPMLGYIGCPNIRVSYRLPQ